MDEPTRQALFGTVEPVPEPLVLQAGALSLELRGTRLLALHAGGHEVWHGVAFLYRDPDWGTPEPVVDAVEHLPRANGFRLDIRAHVPVEPPIAMHIRITGDDSHRVRYEGTAWPQGDIATNRMGLCVMHPLSAMGRQIEIEHGDGRVSRSSFPRLVPPWPPFTLVRAIRHEFADGVWAHCRLEGDSFEFEDQRNNADASFKTYNRSNLMPRPYLLRKGVALRQAAELRLEALPQARATTLPALSLGALASRMPRLGLGLGPEDLADGERLLPLLAELAPIQLHLVLDTPGDAVDIAMLARCVAASATPMRLDVRNAGGDDRRLAALVQAQREACVPIEAVAAFPATAAMIAAVRSALGPVAIGGGTPYFFAQANRIEDLGLVDFLSFTTSSIVHGADDESPMAGLQCLASLVETLRDRHPGRNVRVGPSGIAAPRSPLGRQPPSDGTHRIALARQDPRSGALYGAAWLLGHVAALAPTGLQALSVLGLGVRDGLFNDDGRGLRPSPAWFVLREMRHATRIRDTRSTHPGTVAALGLQRARGGEVLLAANLGPVQTDLAVHDIPAGAPEILDAPSWIDFVAGRRPSPWRAFDLPLAGIWHLPPHAIARLTWNEPVPA